MMSDSCKVSTVLAKKTHSTKNLFWGPKKYLFIIFFFSCLKMVICELMLLELGDLLWSSLLRNYFSVARSIFSWEYCQAQPKSKYSLAEIAIKSDSDHHHNNRGSIKQAEYQPQEGF